MYPCMLVSFYPCFLCPATFGSSFPMTMYSSLWVASLYGMEIFSVLLMADRLKGMWCKVSYRALPFSDIPVLPESDEIIFLDLFRSVHLCVGNAYIYFLSCPLLLSECQDTRKQSDHGVIIVVGLPDICTDRLPFCVLLENFYYVLFSISGFFGLAFLYCWCLFWILVVVVVVVVDLCWNWATAFQNSLICFSIYLGQFEAGESFVDLSQKPCRPKGTNGTSICQYVEVG